MVAQKSFGPEEREAIWEAHNGVCFYCRRLLPFDEMEIDHLVPESILDLSEDKQAAYLATLGFDPSFDVRDFANLAPSCRPCNGRKSDTPFSQGQLAIFLGQLREKAPRVQQAYLKHLRGRIMGSTLRSIANSVDKGHFTLEELFSELKARHQDANRLYLGSTVMFETKASLDRPIELLFASASTERQALGSDVAVRHLLEAVSSGTAETRKREEHGRLVYEIRAHAGLRIKFLRRGDAILVLSMTRSDRLPTRSG